MTGQPRTRVIPGLTPVGQYDLAFCAGSAFLSMSAIRDRLPRGGEGGDTRSIWSRDAGELAACFTVHGRDLFGYACVLTDADRRLAGEMVQAAFDAAASVWGTLRDLPVGQRYDWLRDTLAAAGLDRFAGW